MLLSECECCSQSASAALGVLLSDCCSQFASAALRVRVLFSECECCSQGAALRVLLSECYARSDARSTTRNATHIEYSTTQTDFSDSLRLFVSTERRR